MAIFAWLLDKSIVFAKFFSIRIYFMDPFCSSFLSAYKSIKAAAFSRSFFQSDKLDVKCRNPCWASYIGTGVLTWYHHVAVPWAHVTTVLCFISTGRAISRMVWYYTSSRDVIIVCPTRLYRPDDVLLSNSRDDFWCVCVYARVNHIPLFD